jgi:hypothetical protein
MLAQERMLSIKKILPLSPRQAKLDKLQVFITGQKAGPATVVAHVGKVTGTC